MKSTFNEKTFRNVLLPLALLSISAGANALTLSVDTDARAPATSVGTQQSDLNNTGSGYASAYGSDNSSSYDSSAYSRGFVNSNGVMGAGNSGSGESYSAESELNWSDSYTNTGTAAEDIAFDFLIWGGSLSTTAVDTAGESAESSYWIDILLNGTSVWSSTASLSSTMTGNSLTETGTSLGGSLTTGFGNDAYYSWSETTASLDLGTLEIGETLTLEYIMGGNASGVGILDSGTTCWGEEGEFFPNDGEFLGEVGYRCGGVNSWMAIGDPFGFSASSPSQPPVISGTTVASVPEPETFLLLGAGVFAMGLVSRRRKAKR